MKLYAVHYKALVSAVVFVKAESPEQASAFVHSKIEPQVLLDAAAAGGAVEEDAEITHVEIETSRVGADADATDPKQAKVSDLTGLARRESRR